MLDATHGPEFRAKAVPIGLGEFVISSGKQVALVCYGLGSCIGIAAYDPVSKVGGMAHVVLPDSSLGQGRENGAKFADTGVFRLISEMSIQGAVPSRIIVKLAGGAQMLSAAAFSNKLDIGRRNAEAVQQALAVMNVRVSCSDLGGNFGRTMILLLPEGKVIVSSIGLGEKEL